MGPVGPMCGTGTMHAHERESAARPDGGVRPELLRPGPFSGLAALQRTAGNRAWRSSWRCSGSRALGPPRRPKPVPL